MERPLLRRVLPALACLLAALAVVRAQDGDGPQPAPPKDERPAPAEPAAGDAAAAETKPRPQPPAVGEAFPEKLPVRALPKPGEAAEATAPEDEGLALATLSGAEARPVVLVFWSGRCPVCKRYGEVLAKLAAGFGEKVKVVLVASGAEETADAVRDALAAAKLRLTAVLDTEKKAATALGVRVTPTVFLVDAAGVLRYRGPIDDDRRARSRDARELLKPAVEAVLAGKPVENGDVRPFGSALR